MKDQIEKCVLDKIDFLGASIYIENLIKEFDELCIVGGFLRDAVRYLIENIPYHPQDIDVVVNRGNIVQFMSNKGSNVSRTFFDGYRWRPKENIQIDVWDVNKTISGALNKNGDIIEKHFNDQFLNVDRISFNILNKKIVDDGCIQAVQQRRLELDIRSAHRKMSILDLTRVVSLKRRLRYHLGESLIGIIKDNESPLIKAIKDKAKTNNYTKEKTDELINIAINP